MEKRKIRAKKIAQDVRSGLTDGELMEIYGLTPRTLRYLLTKLVQAGLITDLEFYERSRLTESDVFRAFSDETDAVLRCPNCGQCLPERGEDCVFCTTRESSREKPSYS